MLFLGGGQETTAKAITTGVRLLGEQPALQDRLRAEPARIAAFVEEVLRFDPPVRGIFRVTTSDTEIGGTPVAEGSIVQVLWGSGNRDASAFADPDAFDPDRFAPTADDAAGTSVGAATDRSSRSATASTSAPGRRSPDCRSGSRSRSCSAASPTSSWLPTTPSTTSAARSCVA